MSSKALSILAVLGIIIEYVCVIIISWGTEDVSPETLGFVKASLIWDVTLFVIVGIFHKDSPLNYKKVWEDTMNEEE